LRRGGRATRKTGGEITAGRLVVLRPPRPDDCAAWCTLVKASRPFFADWVSTSGTVPAFHAYVARSRTPAAACRLIHRRADSALLGAINLTEIVRGMFQSGYLGYYIGATYAGRGYMTEALQLMLRTAFRALRLHRVEANIQPDNRASIALVERAGFRREGYSRQYVKIARRWRDHERWALLAEEWRPRRPGGHAS
jgi:ribosomal-protein-alanine N-acetyltransferase